MSFLSTTLVFFFVGFLAAVLLRVLYNKGPSTNLLHLTLLITTVVSCWMVWAIVFLAQTNPLIVPILSMED